MHRRSPVSDAREPKDTGQDTTWSNRSGRPSGYPVPSPPVAALDTVRPRWDDAAQGGAADGAPWETPQPPAVRGRSGWRDRGRVAGGVREAAVAGGIDDADSQGRVRIAHPDGPVAAAPGV